MRLPGDAPGAEGACATGSLRRRGVVWIAAALLLAVAPAESEATDVRLLGAVSAVPFAPSQITLSAQEVANFDLLFTSGTLRLEYWFFPSPFTGASQFGFKTAETTLGQLLPGFSFFNVSRTVPFVLPPDGFYCPSLILTEFTGVEFRPEDWVNFSCRFVGNPPNQPPVAFFTATPSSGPAPLTVVLDASGSTDPDGVIVGYGWAASDGQIDTGIVTLMTFDDPGTYVITLAVLDDDGNSDLVDRTVTVSAPPCSAISPLAPDAVRVASLTVSDCLVEVERGRFYFDLYDITLPEDGRLTVAMSSSEIDPIVAVAPSDLGRIIARDDDGGPGLDALLTTPLAAGRYVIFATSDVPEQTGGYTLTTTFAPEPAEAALRLFGLAAVAAVAARRRRTSRASAATAPGKRRRRRAATRRSGAR